MTLSLLRACKALMLLVTAMFSSSLNAANAITVDNSCLTGCTLSGQFQPHSNGSLASLGLYEAFLSFSLPNTGDPFFGQTALLPNDADFSVMDQNGFGSTTFAAAGTQRLISFSRGPLQTSQFNLQVVTTGVAAGATVGATVSNQPIADMIIAQQLTALGVPEASTQSIASLMTLLNLGAGSDATTIKAAYDAYKGIGGGQTVATVPVPASGLLILLPFGWMTRHKWLPALKRTAQPRRLATV